MKQLLHILKHVLRQTTRKKGSFLLLVILPVICLMVPVALFSSSKETPVRVGICDLDGGQVAVRLVDQLKSESRLQLSPVDPSDANDAVLSGKLDCVLTIPRGWSAGFLSGGAPKLELTSIRGEAVTIWVKQLAARFAGTSGLLASAAQGDAILFETLYDAAGSHFVSVIRETVTDNVTGLNITYLGIGFLIQFMLVNAGRTAALLLEERKNRTLARIRISPASNAAIIGGNVAANLLILALQMVLSLLALRYLLGINTGASIPQFLLLLLPLCLTGVGACLMLVSLAKNDSQLNTLMTVFIYPTCLLSGCFWDIGMMPEGMQSLARFFPQRWALDGIMSMMAGNPTRTVLVNLGVLMAFAAAFFAIALFGFSRSDASAA